MLAFGLAFAVLRFRFFSDEDLARDEEVVSRIDSHRRTCSLSFISVYLLYIVSPVLTFSMSKQLLRTWGPALLTRAARALLPPRADLDGCRARIGNMCTLTSQPVCIYHERMRVDRCLAPESGSYSIVYCETIPHLASMTDGSVSNAAASLHTLLCSVQRSDARICMVSRDFTPSVHVRKEGNIRLMINLIALIAHHTKPPFRFPFLQKKPLQNLQTYSPFSPTSRSSIPGANWRPVAIRRAPGSRNVMGKRLQVPER